MRAMTIAFVLVAQTAALPTAQQVQQWFEEGQDQQIVDAASAATDPQTLYLVGLSYERLERYDDARRVYQSLADRGAEDPWSLVGRAAGNLASPPAAVSAEALADADAAIQQAVTAAPDMALAHYQHGVIEGHKRNYAAAADAFVKAADLDPQFAYAYYYGGLSFSRVDRTDQMAINFERFLRLAPNAPEAGRVESLMRSVRGR